MDRGVLHEKEFKERSGLLPLAPYVVVDSVDSQCLFCVNLIGCSKRENFMRKIIHIDMDCFYAAVELKLRPDLKGKAVAVGGPADSRSVITTASYEARKFGVRSAMPVKQALKLCPHLILLPHHFELYREESRHIRRIMGEYTDKMEPLSLDEAYLDVSDATAHKGSATLIAQEIRQRIFQERNLAASAGVAPNKFLAKVASDWNKPNGIKVIRPEEVAAFVRDLKVEKIHGVGKVMAKKLHDQKIFTCLDLQKREIAELHRLFGSMGTWLHEHAHGIDNREVVTEWETKSVSVEETYDKDIQSLKECEGMIPPLYWEWDRRMVKKSYRNRIKSIVVKIKFFDFTQTTCETSFHGDPQVEDFTQLLHKAFQRSPLDLFRPIRLLGIGTKLHSEAPEQNKLQLSML